MREILFRAKSNFGNVGEWEYGLVAQPHVTEDGIVTSYYFTKLYEDGRLSQKTVSANTIGQYTGLNDKNGKKIFEGDILEKYGFQYIVCFEKGAFIAYEFPYNEGAILSRFEWGNAVKTGNIYDNPELLKGGVPEWQ